MTTPEKWLDAAALDLLHDENAHDLLGNYPEVISQARAALALRDELAAAKKQESAQTTAAQRAWLAADTLRNELSECRAKLAQAQTDIDGWRHGFKCDFCAESEKKLAQAEQERDEARNANLSVRVCRNHTSEVIGEGCLVCDLAAVLKAADESVAAARAVLGWIEGHAHVEEDEIELTCNAYDAAVADLRRALEGK